MTATIINYGFTIKNKKLKDKKFLSAAISNQLQRFSITFVYHAIGQRKEPEEDE